MRKPKIGGVEEPMSQGAEEGWRSRGVEEPRSGGAKE
jgi:hypothetical protein